MTTMVRASLPLVLAAGLLVTCLGGPAAAQEELKTPALAKELVQLMESGKLDAIAAKTDEPEIYVAALYFPGQLLVVRAKYQPSVLLNERLMKKEYRDVYTDLNSASVAGTRVFVMDVGADGLRPKKDDTRFDSCELATKNVAFDGEWKKAKVSEEEYQKSFTEAEGRYADMLTHLIGVLKKGS